MDEEGDYVIDTDGFLSLDMAVFGCWSRMQESKRQ